MLTSPVILFCTSIEATVAELPLVMKGAKPTTQSSTLGSGNFTTPPVAVIFGGAWTDKDVDTVKEGLKKSGVQDDKLPVFLMHDTSKPTAKEIGEEYGNQVLQRTRDTLDKVVAERQGDTGWPSSGIAMY